MRAASTPLSIRNARVRRHHNLSKLFNSALKLPSACHGVMVERFEKACAAKSLRHWRNHTHETNFVDALAGCRYDVIRALLGQVTWALAGTTGGLAGYVKDGATGAPVAGVRVEAVLRRRPSLPPMRAGISSSRPLRTRYVHAQRYQSRLSGHVVSWGRRLCRSIAARYTLTLGKALKTIGHAIATAGNANLVKSGVGGDLYSVNASQAAAAAPLGGGGNLNSAYSAMASVPGVQTGSGRRLDDQRHVYPRTKLLLFRSRG